MLRRVAVENRRAVLIAVVAEIAAGLGCVYGVPECVHQPLVRDLSRIVHYLHRLAVSRLTGGHLLVRRARRVAARVPHGDRHDATDLVEGALHGPEAAPREGRGVERRGGRDGENEQQVHGRKVEERGARGKRPWSLLELSHGAHTPPASSCSAVSTGVASSR